MMEEYLKLVTLGLATLLPIANPLTSVSLYLALGENYSHDERRRQVNRAAIYVVAIMLVSFYAGHAIISQLDISMPGLRIAGGLIVAYIGFTMLFPASQNEADVQVDMASADSTLAQSASSRHTTARPRDIAFVPLAMPGTAGPGTIALIISSAATLHGHGDLDLSQHLAVITVAVLLALLLWICLRSADRLMRILGASGIDAISRIMGFLLISMGVQFVINGVFELATTWPTTSH